MTAVPVLRRLKQEGLRGPGQTVLNIKFEVSFGYVARLYLKTNKPTQRK